MAGSVASPDRREIQDYHRSYLETPGEHGLVVMKRDYFEGKVPCLVVRPSGEPAKRGRLLREQLKGMALPEYGEERGLLVLLHGRNGRKEDLLPVAERFCAVGRVCVIPDLPSHGESPVETVGFGSREFEMALPGRIADEAREEFGWMDLEADLWGMSMGGSFLVHAVADDPGRWRRLVVVSSFDRLSGVVGDSLGWFMGPFQRSAEHLIGYRGGPEVAAVNPVDLAAEISLPVLVVHGDEDELISLKRGKALYGAFAGRKKFVTVPGGNHDNVLVTEAPVYAGMARWLLER